MRRIFSPLTFIFALPLAVASSLTANAQVKSVELFPDHNARPLFATVVGRHGAFTDTFRVDVEAGGADFIAVPDLFCAGAIDYGQPDVTVDYRQGDPSVERLNFMAFAQVGALLLIREPNGKWQCNNDTGLGDAPLISILNPAQGQYAIWVGTIAGGTGNAVLALTEDGLPPESNLQIPSADAPAQGGIINLDTRLPDGPIELAVSAGGANQIPEFLAFCSGNFTAGRPALHIENAPAGQRFSIDLSSGDDTVLAVLTPNGEWLCNDDQFGSDPQVTIEAPLPGRYTVWAGTFSDIGTVSARLSVSEGGILRGVVPEPDNLSQVGDILLSEIAFGQPAIHQIFAGGGDEVSELGAACTGYIDASQPTAHIDTPVAGEDFEVRITSETDTTLIILGPDGEWFCNDDFFDLDPAVYFSNPAAGRYTIWVGTFGSGGDQPPATLTVDLAAG